MQQVLVIVSGIVLMYPLLVLLVCVLYLYKERRRYLRQHAFAQRERTVTVGVFHPYANGGGGGERVLYCALIALVQRFNKAKNERLQVLLYTGDDGLSAAELIERSAERFNLPDLRRERVDTFIKIVPLTTRDLLDPARYPRFTLLWQSLAHVRLALDAFRTGERMGVYPQIWMDTTGCAFTYLVASLRFGCKVVAYVHYPMISTDMIQKVQQRSAGFNNNDAITTSSTRSYAKYIYYHLFAGIYSLVGRYCTDVVMVNSSWTWNHISQLWCKPAAIVYPPCGSMDEFKAYSLSSRDPWVLSIAQFRPEKNQLLQLQALKIVLEKAATIGLNLPSDLKLVMLGSCRNTDDEMRVEELQEYSQALELTKHVQFVVNASYDELKQYLSKSSMGLHTMYNEHFGISVVEMMAAGLIVVANNSGGPAADIVRPGTGYLALTAEEYAGKLLDILQATPDEAHELRIRGRESSQRFSDEEFSEQLIAAMESVMTELTSDT